VESQGERLIVLQDLLELQREMSDADEVSRFRDMGFSMGSRDGALGELDAAITSVRGGIAPALLKRFERVAAKYRRPVALVRNGTCYGCFTKVPTGKNEDAGSDAVSSCPNCGRLVYPI
jgi:hypothetical protein